jgi:hypothetical protein
MLPLHENGGLDERAGTGGSYAGDVVYGVGGTAHWGPAQGPIDWDGDGNATETGVSADVNDVRTPDHDFGCHASPDEVLVGHNDWLSLQYGFRSSAYYADASLRSAGVPSDEPSFEGLLAAAQAADYDGDGFSNAVDNCPVIHNPDQTDTDADGIGDTCEPSTIHLPLILH